MAVQSGNPSIRDVSDPFDVTDKPVRRYEDAKATRLGLEKVGAAGLETAGLTDVNLLFTLVGNG